MNYALIGGTGVEHLELDGKRAQTIQTPYGLVEVEVGSIANQEIAFVKRHGAGHAVPPHLVNYRGNIWAIKELGVKKILATAAVGSLSTEYRLGELVLLDQFLDFTKTRIQTFFEGGTQGVLHVDLTEPYCKDLQKTILTAGKQNEIVVKTDATYVCTEGPRFETPAEIRMFQMLGGHLVGMTSVPEVVLAREQGMCYASIGMVTNEAAGIADHPLTHAEVMDSMKMLSTTVAQLISDSLKLLTPVQHCSCVKGNEELGKF
ncbi:MAG: S-methyl-5'-thioadenosine phosphorylase [Desulfitobacterium hafniense]|nr:S-methyl-5'-thioadenosine phosphorylase [Desulfitobacterium hafniense]